LQRARGGAHSLPFSRNKSVKIAQSLRPSFWRREHHLDKMSLKELVVAYVQYPAIIAYFALSLVALGVFAWRPAPLAATLVTVVASALIYPLVWYVLHRWVLHSRWMWKVSILAGTWKRIHYDHHQDPNHLEVLFGALHTTLPPLPSLRPRSDMPSAASGVPRPRLARPRSPSPRAF
jgi:hypothetical protein